MIPSTGGFYPPSVSLQPSHTHALPTYTRTRYPRTAPAHASHPRVHAHLRTSHHGTPHHGYTLSLCADPGLLLVHGRVCSICLFSFHLSLVLLIPSVSSVQSLLCCAVQSVLCLILCCVLCCVLPWFFMVFFVVCSTRIHLYYSRVTLETRIHSSLQSIINRL